MIENTISGKSLVGASAAARRKNQPYTAKLNLVSLMDIFTILVFFLLINSGESQELDKAKFVKLPSSTATPGLQDNLVILVGKEDIMVNDVSIAKVSDIMAAPQKEIAELAKALIAHAEKEGDLKGFQKTNGRSVTIMGDRDVPYTLLKSVMVTCSQQNFRDISLAVNQVVGGSIASNSSSLTSTSLASITKEG